mgnify:CR=1 FL=1
MIKYSIKQDNGEEMNGQAKLVIMSTIDNEGEEGYEGKTAIVTTDGGNVTAGIALLALANLVANVVKNVAKNVAEDDDEKAQMLDYIINTAIGMIHKESLN